MARRVAAAWVRCFACVLLAGGWVGDARAEDAAGTEPAGYRSLVDEAVLEFSERNFEESRALFARANALYPNARALRGLGFAEYELRNYSECIEQLEAALGSTVRPLERELRHDTERLLARARNFVGSVVVELRPANARLTLDGNPVTLAPGQALVLPIGTHTLEAQAPGFSSAKRQLRVTGGEQQMFSLILLQAGAATQPVLSRPDSSSQKRWYKSPWLWGALGVVAVGSATTALVLTQGGSTVREQPNGGSTSAVLVGPSQ